MRKLTDSRCVPLVAFTEIVPSGQPSSHIKFVPIKCGVFIVLLERTMIAILLVFNIGTPSIDDVIPPSKNRVLHRVKDVGIGIGNCNDP
jgi:hypothetical protein